MRHLGTTLLLFLAAGGAALAKGVPVLQPGLVASSKAQAKLVLAGNSHGFGAQVAAKRPILKPDVVVVTSDLSRAALAARLASMPPEKSAALAAQAKSAATASTRLLSADQPVLATRDHPSPASISSRNAPVSASVAAVTPVRTDAPATAADGATSCDRLARVTAYWSDEGDYYTGRGISATGVRLHDGHCAVDPNIIPYGSVVNIEGVGKFLAVDTGSAVIHRTAAREGGHTYAERHAIVVDLFFEDPREGERFAAGAAKYVAISWYTPDSTGTAARAARSLFAEEDWTKIQSKQL